MGKAGTGEGRDMVEEGDMGEGDKGEAGTEGRWGQG